MEKEEVDGILSKAFPNSKPKGIKKFQKGLINKTYEAKVGRKEVILRIYPQDMWKIKKEMYLYSLISKKAGVPVPKVISHGKNFLLMSKIRGKELSPANRKGIRKAGEILAKIHSIRFSSYGWIINKEIRPSFRRWDEFIRYDTGLKFRKIPSRHSGLKLQVRKIIDENKSLLKISSRPCLLHKDYHFSHIIAYKGRINGIIDIEWAISGHNEFDIVKSCLWMFEKKPKLEKIFLEGYQRYGKISERFEERKRLYRILHLLSSFSFSYECRNKGWCTYNLKELKGEIDEYNKAY
ncbi:aminoglycoside phosphotransferase family protein [Candidatus Woesearchaeota archaeon]|nr:aminoglycoside phosphotransferase family protein [Candidatus Woesearchaeota archaeon]